MTENKTVVSDTDNAESAPGLDLSAGIASAAASASAESQEILNLLGDNDGGSCCGGGCCSVE